MIDKLYNYDTLSKISKSCKQLKNQVMISLLFLFLRETI